jgi:hypothetical protein
VYGWIWRSLPGNLAAKFLECAVLFVGVLAVLFLVVFPWVEPKLPWNDTNIDSPSVSQQQSPAATGSPQSPATSSPAASVLPAG